MKTRVLISTVIVLVAGGFFLGRTSAQRGPGGGADCIVPAIAGAFRGVDDEYQHMTFEDSAGTIRIYKTYPWQNVAGCSLVFRTDRK